jgi:hypothetical protein
MEPMDDDGDAGTRRARGLALLGALGLVASACSTSWFAAVSPDDGTAHVGPATFIAAGPDTIHVLHHGVALAFGILALGTALFTAASAVWMARAGTAKAVAWTSTLATLTVIFAGCFIYLFEIRALVGPGLPVFLASSVLILVGAALV